uniref:Uncharacterized protein n=1 Tax=Oryza meridionalis TaxID=40149 RepID=A0A0E0DKI6_9ORYZ
MEEMKGRGGCSSIPSGMEVETEGRGSEGKGRRVEDNDKEYEEEGRSGVGKAPAAKSRRIDGQEEEEEENEEEEDEEEDGYRDSRCVELVFGEEEELDPVQMEEKLRQVKLEMKGKYTDEADEEEQMRRYHTSWDSSVSPLRSLPTHKYSHFITVSINHVRLIN